MNAFFQGVALAVALASLPAVASDAPTPDAFAWRGTLAMPAGASLVRVDMPVQALMQQQSSNADDLRVFNAAGAVVPYALLGRADLSHAAPQVQTPAYSAYPLFAASAAKPLRGAVQVQVDSGGNRSSAWVRWDNTVSDTATDATAQPLQAALFDLRGEQQTLDALRLSVELPHNALVPLTVSTSTDLKDWTPLATQGPVFQFDGMDAPSNTVLEFRQPVSVKGRYLRLTWAGQSGVKVASLTGRVAATQTAPALLRAPLPPGTLDGNSLNWTLPFATPIAALHLQAAQNNTLLPVRILGRADAAQPWRTLASSVVYRLDTVGTGTSNSATPLHGASVRALRVEAAKGQALPEGGLQATLEFAPLQVAFLASGAGPYTLAVGRAQTPSAAVDASLLGSVAPAKLAELPLATVTAVALQPPAGLAQSAPGWLAQGVPLRTVLLWLVLGVGVLVLGGVAYALMRQLQSKR